MWVPWPPSFSASSETKSPDGLHLIDWDLVTCLCPDERKAEKISQIFSFYSGRKSLPPADTHMVELEEDTETGSNNEAHDTYIHPWPVLPDNESVITTSWDICDFFMKGHGYAQKEDSAFHSIVSWPLCSLIVPVYPISFSVAFFL